MSFPSNDGRSGRGARARGFTLVELMIAIVLLAIIFSLLYTSFFQISTGTSRIKDQLTHQQHVRLLMKMIGDDLQAAQFLKGFVEDSGAKSGLFASEEPQGTSKFSSLRFHAAIPARFYPQVPPEKDPNLHEVAYWVEPAEEDRDKLVLMRREDFYLDDDMTEGGVSARMAEDVQVFKVEFLPVARRKEEFEDDWVDEWNSADKEKGEPLPMAVRITLTLPDKEGKPLTEQLVINMPTTFKVIQ